MIENHPSNQSPLARALAGTNESKVHPIFEPILEAIQAKPQRTLAEIADDYGDAVEVYPNGCKTVYADRTERLDYWHCSDYAVSSVCGPMIYFCPRAEGGI